MAWPDALISLVGVALGGGIAAAAGSRSAQRSNTAAALQALADMRDLRYAREPDEAGIPDRDLMRRVRADLLTGGAPWVLVEMHERATEAALLGTWHISRSLNTEASERQRKYAQAIFHPSRFSTRPILQLGDSLEQAIAESLERPFLSAMFGPWRRAELRRAVETVAKENEITRFPPCADDSRDSIWRTLAIEPATRWLTWPRRRARRQGYEHSIQGDGWYPKWARRSDET